MNILLAMTKQHLLLNRVLAVLFLVFSYSASPAGSSLDTLKPGDFLNSSTQLVSPNKLFTLGFYNPDDRYNSNDTYLAIQFNSGRPKQHLLLNTAALFLVFSYSASPAGSSLDTLKPGDFLNSSTQLVSPRKLFRLRFYNPDPYRYPYYNPSDTYLDLQHNFEFSSRNTPIQNKSALLTIDSLGNLIIKINQTIASLIAPYSSQTSTNATANRNTPIQNKSALLTIDSLGNLIIKINQTTTTLIAPYSSQTSTNATATLLNTGNFVLRETSSNGSVGKVLWRGPNVEFEQSLAGSSPHRYILMKISEASNEKWRIIVIAVVVSVAILLFCLLCYLNRKIRQAKAKKLLELMTLDGYTNTIVLEKDGKKGQDLKFFSYSCILASTNIFSSENKLGEGGFGPVYKGKLPEGQEIAVKRLSRKSGQGLHEFKTELVLIAKLQHTNLVRLFGCCIHGEEKMLIYEFMPNGSLDFFLFDQTKSMQLSWERRFIIIEGIAQGLLYLHKYSRLRIVHRDLKASNILLDENMNPKISDFGTARICNKNLTEENTNKITGTRGYMAPEYLMEGTFSMKSDVYSFGVLMLEIVSGRKNNSFYDVEVPLNLVTYASELWNRNAAIQLMDPALHGSSTIHEQVERCIHIGLLCVQHTAVDRPTMSDVISMISPDSSALPLPKPPAFFTSPALIEENQGRTKSRIISVNGLSISEIGAR